MYNLEMGLELSAADHGFPPPLDRQSERDNLKNWNDSLRLFLGLRLADEFSLSSSVILRHGHQLVEDLLNWDDLGEVSLNEV